MKRSVKSIILLGVLAALLGSYRLVDRATQRAEVSAEAGSFDLVERSADELNAIAWTNEGVEYRFVREEAGWAKDGDAAFPVNQQAVEEMAERLTSLQADRRLRDVEKMEDYGFSEDSFAVTAEWTDGETSRYVLGDATPFGDGWYLRIDGEDTVVYTAGASLEAMFAERDIDLAELEEIGSVENAAALQVGDGLELVYRAQGSDFDPDQHWYGADGEPMDDAGVEALLIDIDSLQWQELRAVNVAEEEMAQYGLDDGSATLIRVTGDDGARVDICIGAMDDAGDYYARLSGSGMVYTLDGGSVDAIFASDAEALWNDAIFPLEYEDLRQFSRVLNGEERLYLPADDANEGAEDAAETVESGETDETEALWQQISALRATDRGNGEVGGEVLLEIEAINVDGASLRCAFYGYDVDSYLAVTSEDRSLLVPADDVDRLIRALR